MAAMNINKNQFEEMIRDVKNRMRYPRALSILGAFLVASSFTVLFGGDFLDAAVAGIIGILIVVLESFSFKNIVLLKEFLKSSKITKNPKPLI